MPTFKIKFKQGGKTKQAKVKAKDKESAERAVREGNNGQS